MVAFDNSVTPAASTTTRYYGACPERSRGNDQRVLLETDATAAEFDLRYFVYGNYIDEVLAMHMILSPTAGFTFYYAQDHLYSPVAMFSAGGTVVERYEYDAYGDVTIWDGTFAATRTTSSFKNPYFFTGRRLDSMDNGSLNLMYYRARTYDPETGRFMQRDPLGIDPTGGKWNSFWVSNQYSDGLNLYGYVKGNSLKYTDYDGRMISAPSSPELPQSPICSTARCIDTCIEKGSNESECTKRCEEAYQKFMDWYKNSDDPDFSKLPSCPCTIKICQIPGSPFGGGQTVITVPSPFYVVDPSAYPWYLHKYHPGATYDVRSRGCPSQQCTYDKSGKLITHGPGAGTADSHQSGIFGCKHGRRPKGHTTHDTNPADWAMFLDGDASSWPIDHGGCFQMYIEKRPIDQGKDENKNPCPRNPK